MSAASRYSVILCLAVVSAQAQISTGTIVGNVEDSSGALIPNGEVTLTQTATSETRRTRTTGSGEFNVPFLLVGPYSVTASAAGFKSKTLTGIELRVDQTLN